MGDGVRHEPLPGAGRHPSDKANAFASRKVKGALKQPLPKAERLRPLLPPPYSRRLAAAARRAQRATATGSSTWSPSSTWRTTGGCRRTPCAWRRAGRRSSWWWGRTWRRGRRRAASFHFAAPRAGRLVISALLFPHPQARATRNAQLFSIPAARTDPNLLRRPPPGRNGAPLRVRSGRSRRTEAGGGGPGGAGGLAGGRVGRGRGRGRRRRGVAAREQGDHRRCGRLFFGVAAFIRWPCGRSSRPGSCIAVTMLPAALLASLEFPPAAGEPSQREEGGPAGLPVIASGAAGGAAAQRERLRQAAAALLAEAERATTAGEDEALLRAAAAGGGGGLTPGGQLAVRARRASKLGLAAALRELQEGPEAGGQVRGGGGTRTEL